MNNRDEKDLMERFALVLAGKDEAVRKVEKELSALRAENGRYMSLAAGAHDARQIVEYRAEANAERLYAKIAALQERINMAEFLVRGGDKDAALEVLQGKTKGVKS